jgi:hypothetical protein
VIGRGYHTLEEHGSQTGRVTPRVTVKRTSSSVPESASIRATPRSRCAGRSAIRAMARKVLEIDGMSGEDCTFSVGIVQGGQWVNRSARWRSGR